MTDTNGKINPLEPYRKRIDKIDEEVVRLLNERAEMAIEIGKHKIGSDRPTYAPDREAKVLNHIRSVNHGPFSDATIEAIYREIMSGSFALERPPRIGYLGPAGSFSHVAAMRQFGSSVDYTPLDDITHVFQAVERSTIDLGLVPIENSTGGGITDTLDSFLQSSVQICAEVLIRIHHNLLSNEEFDQIKRICSKPQIFEQCRKWLSEHLRGTEHLPVGSSARAAETAANEKGTAAIGSILAGDTYGVKALYTNIEDNPNNVTRFFVIGREAPKQTGDDKTAIMFTTAHKSGALADVLDVFRQNGINLTHIDKRPSQRVNWEYYFFVDCEGHITDQNMIEALQGVRGHCLHVTVLGSFPRARNVLE